jgi:hypothetical protein
MAYHTTICIGAQGKVQEVRIRWKREGEKQKRIVRVKNVLHKKERQPNLLKKTDKMIR